MLNQDLLEYQSKHFIPSIISLEFEESKVSAYLKQAHTFMLKRIKTGDKNCKELFTRHRTTDAVMWDSKQERYNVMAEMDLYPIFEALNAFIHEFEAPTASACIGRIAASFKQEELTTLQGLQCAADLLDCFLATPLAVYEKGRKRDASSIVSNIDLDCAELISTFIKQPKPLVLAPLPVKNNSSYGYHNFQGSLLLSGKHHDHPLNYRHINRVNQVKFTVETAPLFKMEPKWEVDPEWTPKQLKQEEENWEAKNKESVRMYAMYADQIFHFAHRYCERQRTYCVGHGMNYQGDSYRKGAITLATHELIYPDEYTERGEYNPDEFLEFTNWEYLLIELANQYGHGLDKAIYQDRIEFIRENLDILEQLEATAETPNMFIRAVIWLRKAQANEPTRSVIGFDATASGLQINSLSTRDESGLALFLNHPDKERRCNPYKQLGDTMDFDCEYEELKQAAMTFDYGSKKIPELVFGDRVEMFYENFEATLPYVYSRRQDMLGAWNPGAKAHMWTMPNGSIVHKQVMVESKYNLELPLSVHKVAYVASTNEPKKRGVSLAADTTHSCDGFIYQELTGYCSYSQVEMAKALELLNDIDFMDVEPAEHFVSIESIEDMGKLTLPELKQLHDDLTFVENTFHVYAVHDCFNCSASNMNQLRRVYNHIAAKMYKYNVLGDIYNQLTGEELAVGDYDEATYEAIHNANYLIN